MARAPISLATFAITAALVATSGMFSPAWGSVSAPAAPPVLTVPGSQTVSEEQSLAFSVTAADPEGQAVYLYATSLPTGASFLDRQNGTGSFSWTPDPGQAGSYTVVFFADDSFGGIDSKSVGIEVLPVNRAPEMNPIGSRTVERASVVHVSLSGFDPDWDAIAYSASGLPFYATLMDFGGGSGDLMLAPTGTTPLGTSTITIRLSDGSLEASETFDVTVVASAAQNPPTLSPIGNQTVMEGSAHSVPLSAKDADSDPLVWTVSIPGFANMVVTGNGAGSSSARLDLAPGFCESGDYPATISINDGSFSDSERFTIHVADVNRAPAWALPAGAYAVALIEGGAGSLPVAATDPDVACGSLPPALSLQGSDAGTMLALEFSDAGNGDGTLHMIAAGDAAGAYHVTLRASDRFDPGLFGDAVVAVTVRAADEPVLARAWSHADPIRLDIGKPREAVFLEPANESFPIRSILPGSIRLKRSDGSGPDGGIAPMPERFYFGIDRDRNGVEELRMEFAKEDLRALVADAVEMSGVRLCLTADLAEGGKISATLGASLIPERQRGIKRIGPNPLNPEAVITVRTERAGHLRVRVYDLNGRLVRTLVDLSSVSPGERDVRFNGMDDGGRRLSSGRYFVKVESASGADAASLTILK